MPDGKEKWSKYATQPATSDKWSKYASPVKQQSNGTDPPKTQVQVQEEKETPVVSDPFADVQPIQTDEDPLLTIMKERQNQPAPQQVNPQDQQVQQQIQGDEVAFQQGAIKAESGDNMGAYGDFTKAVSINPNNDRAIAALGNLSIEDNLPQDALKYYAAAFEKNPNPNNLNGVTRSLVMMAHNSKDEAERTKFLEAADSNIKSLLELNPRDAYALATRGWIAKERGDSKQAELDFLNSQTAELPDSPAITDNARPESETETRSTGEVLWQGLREGTPKMVEALTVDAVNQMGEGAIHGVSTITKGLRNIASLYSTGLTYDQIMGDEKIAGDGGLGAFSKQYLTGVSQILHGGASLALTAAMANTKGYVFLQGINVADRMSNGVASKLVMAPLVSFLQPKDELAKNLLAIADIAVTLGAFHVAGSAFSKKPVSKGGYEDLPLDEYIVNDAITRLREGKSLNGQQTELVYNAVKDGTNVETIQKVVDALAAAPDGMPPNRIIPTITNHLISEDASNRIKTLQDSKNEILKKDDLTPTDIKKVTELTDQINHIEQVRDDFVGRDAEYQGEIITLKKDDEGNLIYTGEDGKTRILPVEDKTNPEASFEQIGLEILPELTPEQVKKALADGEQIGTVFSNSGNEFFVSLANPKTKGAGVGDQVMMVGKNGKMKEVPGMTDETKLVLINKFLKEKGLPEREGYLKNGEIVIPKAEENVLPTESSPEPVDGQKPATGAVEEVKPAEPAAETPTEEIKAPEETPVVPELKQQNPIVEGSEVVQTIKPTPDQSRQFAIEMVVNDLVEPGSKSRSELGLKGSGKKASANTDPRLDLGMSSADKNKAIADIKKGNFETAPAKKLIAKLSEFHQNDAFELVRGTGGKTDRYAAYTREDAQRMISEAKTEKVVDDHPMSGEDALDVTEWIRRFEDEQGNVNFEAALRELDALDWAHTPEKQQRLTQLINKIRTDETARKQGGTGEGDIKKADEAKGGENVETPGSRPSDTGAREKLTQELAPEIGLAEEAANFAAKVRELKGKPLTFKDENGIEHEVKQSSFYDEAIEITASLIEKAGKVLDHTKLGDAILAGLKHIRSTDWYKALKFTEKKEVIKQFKEMFAPLQESLVRGRKENPERTIRETTGVTKKQDKVTFTVNEKTALKDQIKSQAKAALIGYKEAKFQQKEFAKKIENVVKSQQLRGTINASQYKTIVKAASRVNSTERLNDFIEFSNRVIEDANYARDLKIAKDSLSEAIGKLKGENIPVYNKQIVSALRGLNPNRVTDIVRYADILQNLSKELQGKQKSRKYTQNEIEQFIAKEQELIRIENDRRLQEELYQHILNGDVAPETTLAEYKSMLEDLDLYQQQGKITEAVKDRIADRIKDNIATLKDEANAARVIQNNVRPENALEKQTMDAVMEFDPYTADTKTLQRLNNVLNNFIESGDLSGAGEIVASHQSAVRFKAAKDEAIKIKQLSTDKKFLFSTNIARKSLPNILRELTYSKKAAASVADLTITKIKQVAANAHEVRNKVMTNILKVADKANLREHNNYRMHVYSMLAQAKSFTIDGEVVTFEGMKKRLLDDAERMIDYGSKLDPKAGGPVRGKDYVEWGNAIKDIINNDFKDTVTAEDVYAKLNDAERQVHSMTQDFFNARSGRTQQVTEIVENKSMPLVEDYFPLDAMRLGEESTAKLELNEADFSKHFVSKRQAGSTIKRQPLEHDRVYNPQFLHVFGKKAFEQEFYNNGQQELHTLSKVLNDKQFADIVNETSNPERNLENAETMRETLSTIVNEWKQSGSLPNPSTQVVNYILRKTVGTLLSTVGQLPKQYIPNIAQSAVINGIGPTIRAMSLRYGRERIARDQLLSAMSGKIASGRGEVVLEESLYKDQLAGMKSNAFATLRKGLSYLPNPGKAAFALGDQAGRNDAFLSSYIKSLMDQGLIKGAADFDIVKEAANPNQQALSYAEITAPTISNISTAAERPKLVKELDNKDWTNRIQWTLLTYGLNSYESAKTATRILFDARSTKSERVEAVGDLSGYLVQIATFAAVSGLVKQAYRQVGQQTASALGFEMTDDDKKKALEKDIMRTTINALTSVTLQGSPLWLQESGQIAVNQLYQFINKRFITEHPYSKENKGTIADARFKPFYGTDHPTLGIIDVPIDIISEAAGLVTSGDNAEKRKVETLITMSKVAAMILSNGDLYALANYTSAAVYTGAIQKEKIDRMKELGVDDIFEQEKDIDIAPPLVKNTLTIDGETKTLTPEEHKAFSDLVAQKRKDYIKILKESDDYIKAKYPQKLKWIKAEYDNAREDAKKEFFNLATTDDE